jgi:hypothetical protein
MKPTSHTLLLHAVAVQKRILLTAVYGALLEAIFG